MWVGIKSWTKVSGLWLNIVLHETYIVKVAIVKVAIVKVVIEFCSRL